MSQFIFIIRTFIFGHSGYSVNLVKENTVHSGKYELVLEVSDLQLKTAVHDLSVIVCNCLKTGSPECVSSRAVTLGAAALWLIFCSIFLLVGKIHAHKTLFKIFQKLFCYWGPPLILIQDIQTSLMYVALFGLCVWIPGIPLFLMSYKRKIKQTNTVFLDDCPGHLMKYSTETPGTDCKVNTL